MFKNAFANLQKVGKSLMLPLYRMLWQKQAVPSLQTCH